MNTLIKIILLFIMTNAFSQSEIVSEDILLKNGDIKLPGTLTFNKDVEEQPLVIFVHGSGNVDRNGNQNGTPYQVGYIKLLAEALNEKNIAFYRYDKRTSSIENFQLILDDLNFDAFVKDTEIAINHFKNDKRFSSITLIGHSQGSLVAMLASKNIDKYISLAGPSLTIDEAMTDQVMKQNPVTGTLVKGHFKELKETGTIKEPNQMLMSIFNEKNNPFFLSWMQYNPTEEIKKVTIPTLIINGTKDLQVSTTDAENLHKANGKSQLKFIANMTHVLKTIEKDEDNLASYTSTDFPLSLELVTVISEFIKQ